MAENNYLNLLDKDHQKLVVQIGEEARNRHCKAYLIGGIVRDLILNRKNLDLDIVVEGDALQLAQAMGKSLKMNLTVHESFQTGTLHGPNQARIDFATARREMYPKPGALPVVETAHLDADIFRRDFTINALAIAINPGTYGKLIDLYGGVADLEKGLVRIFHENSFVDDPTRILRAVRFEQRFNFEIEPATRQFLLEAIKQKRHETVKMPRYFNEFKKILTEDDPVPALRRLKELGGLNFWKTPLKTNFKDLTLLRRKMNEYEKKRLVPEFADRWLLFMMALMEDLDKGKMLAILSQLQIRKEFVESIAGIHDRFKIFKELGRKGSGNSRIYRLLQAYSPETLLYFHFRSLDVNIRRRIEHYLKKSRCVQLRVTGDDIKRLGVQEGKKVGLILQKLLDEKIDRSLKTKGQELKAARTLFDLP